MSVENEQNLEEELIDEPAIAGVDDGEEEATGQEEADLSPEDEGLGEDSSEGFEEEPEEHPQEDEPKISLTQAQLAEMVRREQQTATRAAIEELMKQTQQQQQRAKSGFTDNITTEYDERILDLKQEFRDYESEIKRIEEDWPDNPALVSLRIQAKQIARRHDALLEKRRGVVMEKREKERAATQSASAYQQEDAWVESASSKLPMTFEEEALLRKIYRDSIAGNTEDASAFVEAFNSMGHPNGSKPEDVKAIIRGYGHRKGLLKRVVPAKKSGVKLGTPGEKRAAKPAAPAGSQSMTADEIALLRSVGEPESKIKKHLEAGTRHPFLEED